MASRSRLHTAREWTLWKRAFHEKHVHNFHGLMSISHVLDVLRPSHSLSRLITCCPSLELLRSRANLLNRRILLTRFCFCGRPEDASAIQHQLTYQIVCNCGMHNDLLSTHIFCALCFLFFHSSPPRFTFNMFRSHYKYLHGNKPIT